MDDFAELESELKRLRPAPVTPEVMLRLEQALDQPQFAATAGVLPRAPRRNNLWWALGLGLTTAAALVLIGLMFTDESKPAQPRVAQTSQKTDDAPGTGLQPDALTQVVYRQQDEGLIFSPNQTGRPLRRVRLETRETMQWRNPRTGASLQVSYPAEQVVLSPVSFQ